MREDVKLRQGQRREAVHAYGEAERDQVEPAAAALAPRRRAVLGPKLADARLVVALDLGREGPLPDASDVRLRHADHAVDTRRADPCAGRGGAGGRARRGDERVGAVVEVEERPLGALEEHAATVAEGAVDEERRIRDVRAEARGERLHPVGELLHLERLDAVDPLEQDILLRERGLELLAKDLRVEDVLHADADACRLVGVGGADAAAGRADLEAPEPPLARRVDGDVPRHDQVGVSGDAEVLGRDAALLSSSSSRTSRPGSTTQPAPTTQMRPG